MKQKLTTLKVKSPHRMIYESEVVVIKRLIGDLEQIRQNLGLSQRKICQLLMVDPSAWTRWIKTKGGAPPHVYRALQWYLQLIDKHPSLKPALFLADFRASAPTLPAAPNPEFGRFRESLVLVMSEIKRLKQIYVFALLACLAIVAVFVLNRLN
ncbi:MAG: hypothetical protein SGJ18_04155 [Pseudomonadota bacterium]|nr:hypothetical protein [Pseudomonadota bacterium]